MSIKTVRVSDLSGSEEEVEGIAFALAGQAFTLDLTAKEHEAFLKAFEKYTAVATPASATERAGKAKAEKSGPTQAQLMREWAKANSVALPAKGVVPKEVRDRYRAAMAKDAGAALKEEAKPSATTTAAPVKQTPPKVAAGKEFSASK